MPSLRLLHLDLYTDWVVTICCSQTCWLIGWIGSTSTWAVKDSITFASCQPNISLCLKSLLSVSIFTKVVQVSHNTNLYCNMHNTKAYWETSYILWSLYLSKCDNSLYLFLVSCWIESCCFSTDFFIGISYIYTQIKRSLRIWH